MNKHLSESPAAQRVRRMAREQAEFMATDPASARITPYARSEAAIRILLAGAMRIPKFRAMAEEALAEHRSQHGGTNDQNCEACGYFTAAAYEAQTGRSLADDIDSGRTRA